MSEPEEDFAAMFEASFKAKRYENGQTLEGTIVAIGDPAVRRAAVATSTGAAVLAVGNPATDAFRST